MPQSKDAFDPLIGQADWESSEEGKDEKREKCENYLNIIIHFCE